MNKVKKQKTKIKSNKPYIMEIKKFKENEYLINSDDRFKFKKEFS